jgi:hypothetical protein
MIQSKVGTMDFTLANNEKLTDLCTDTWGVMEILRKNIFPDFNFKVMSAILGDACVFLNLLNGVELSHL